MNRGRGPTRFAARKPAPSRTSRSQTRKKDVVAKVLAARCDAPGLAHLISATETCATYQLWRDKAGGRTTFLGKKISPQLAAVIVPAMARA